MVDDLVGLDGVGEVGVPVVVLDREADADGAELREADDRLEGVLGDDDTERPVVLVDLRGEDGRATTRECDLLS